MSAKNTVLLRRSARLSSQPTTSSSADNKPVPEMETMVSDAGLKIKQGEMGVNDAEELISSLEAKISKAEEVFHNIVMRLTTHSAMGDALWFELGEDLGCYERNLELQMSNSKFDNDDDAVKLSLLYIVFCIPLSNASSVKIDPKYFALADNLDAFNEFPWGVLSWEATRTAICSTALLVWTYETSPVIASKFTTNYEHALPRMMSWTTADNVRFDDVLAAFATVGESKCVVLTPTEEELKNPCVARLFLNLPKAQPQLPPSKSSFPRPSTDTNSEWREFQKEIRTKIASLNKNNEKGQGQPHTAHEDAENENNKVNIAEEELNEGEANAKAEPSVEEIAEEAMPDLEKGVTEEDDGKEIIPDQDPSILDEPSNEDNIGALIPKKKRARLSSLRQRPSGRTTDIGSPSKAPTNLIYALPPCLADQPPEQTLEEFREWIKAEVLKRSPPSKQPPRYGAKHDTLCEPHDLGFMLHIDVAFYYLRKKSRQFTELKQRMVTTVDTFYTSKIRSLWRIHQSSPANFDWGSCESILKIMTGVQLELTSWTIEVYDSLQHEGRHNARVREGLECLAVFIPMLAERINLFDVKKREPPGIHPIPVTIMKDIPKQVNGLV
ncbi:hypothetical protein TIFTF001_040085 [Ficus carica]|uniref:DUF1985 domain-containing protein n=1 Tax=Ficus carica TaxID=3494 RepID=A0AA87YRN6_FICCA|nr:hypothetical protein TIFTF001_040085 [Ficus carica]